MSINAVAPLAGAWIEIGCKVHAGSGRNVAPLAGAWIEIFFLLSLHKQFLVAPLAGAWIEMLKKLFVLYSILGRSPRGSVD